MYPDAGCGSACRAPQLEPVVYGQRGTEQEPGEQIRYCLVCSDGIEYRTIPAKNHEHQFPLTRVAKVDATCTTAGTEAHYICDANGTSEATSGCGCLYLDDKGEQQIADSDLWIAPTIEHKWGDWAYPPFQSGIL